MRTSCSQSEIKHVSLANKVVVAMLWKNWFMLLAVRISSYGCTWEVWRALKSTQEARVTLLSCSPNFPRASITRYTHAKHEPILNYTVLIVHTLWLAAERALFSCNDQSLWNIFSAQRLFWVVSKTIKVYERMGGNDKKDGQSTIIISITERKTAVQLLL